MCIGAALVRPGFATAFQELNGHSAAGRDLASFPNEYLHPISRVEYTKNYRTIKPPSSVDAASRSKPRVLVLGPIAWMSGHDRVAT